MPNARDESTPQQTYPYAMHLDTRYPPLEVVDIQALIDACTDRWYNQTLCRANDSVVRLGVVEGEYHWHKHDHEDEFFYVVEGRFLIDLEDRTVELTARQGFVVPKGTVHRTRAPERTVILMVEGAGIAPTGDQRGAMEVLIPILALAIPVSAIVFHGLQKVWRLRIEEANVRAKALAAQGSSEVEGLRAEVAELREELDEVQERLDFTERVVMQNRDRHRLPGHEAS